MKRQTLPIAWLKPGDAMPPAAMALGEESPAPGLLAAGGDLSVSSLINAYSSGVFPWFSEGQPILWWSPSPRMVLRTSDFRLHRSMRRTLQAFRHAPACEIRIDSAFSPVIQHCSNQPRSGQSGTWIVPDMVAAYCDLHRHGTAHSVETWVDGHLQGGLYCVAIGGAVFGESMFSLATDASKIALAALVAFCRAHDIEQIDCQQNTRHLASLGAREISRPRFLHAVEAARHRSAPAWHFDPVYWNQLDSAPHAAP